MFEVLSALPPIHLAYLIAAVAAFSLFGVTLAAVSISTNARR